MSTILRALQKIEENSVEEDGQPGPSQPIKASQTISKRLTVLWYQQLGRRFLWIALGLVAASLVIFLAINLVGKDTRRDVASLGFRSNGIVSENSMLQRVPLSQTDDGNVAMQERGPTRPHDYSPKPTHDPNHQTGRYTGKSSRKISSAPPMNTAESQFEPPLETEMVSPDLETEDLNADPDEFEEPIEILESDPEELRYAQVALLESGNLELQAVSWAKDPVQRIAVINNEIVHQGQMVENYKILHIGADNVVVEKGGEQWKLIFMVR